MYSLSTPRLDCLAIAFGILLLGPLALRAGDTDSLTVNAIPVTVENQVMEWDIDPGTSNLSPRLWSHDGTGKEEPIPSQFTSTGNGAGRLFWLMPGESKAGTSRSFTLRLDDKSASPSLPATIQPVRARWEGGNLVVSNGLIEVTHDTKRGGTISSVKSMAGSGFSLPVEMRDAFVANGSRFEAAKDQAAVVTVSDPESEGGLGLVVQAAIHYSDAKTGRSTASATYRYIYRAGSAQVRIEVSIPSQDRSGALELFVFDFGKDSPFKTSVFARPDGRGVLVPQRFPWDPGMARPNGGIILEGEKEAFAVITPLAPTYRYDLDKGESFLDSKTFDVWTGEPVLATATLWFGPRPEADRQVALMTPPRISAVVSALQTRISALQKLAAESDGARGTLLSTLAGAARQRMMLLKDLKQADQLLAAAESLSSQNLPPVATLEAGSFIALANSQTGLLFELADKQIFLAGLFDRKGHAFTQVDGSPLWRAVFSDTQDKKNVSVFPANAQDFSYQIERSDANAARLVLRWSGVPAGESSVQAKATVSLRASDPLTDWQIKIDPVDKRLGLWELLFPLVRVSPDPQSPSTDFALAPYKTGTSLPNPSSAGIWKLSYPGEAGWAFTTYWQGTSGLYLGAHDPRAGVKEVNLFPTGDGSLELSFGIPPPDQGLSGTGYDMPYSIRLGAFEGDWYEAAQIYREWLVQQDWFPKETFADRKDVPQWLKNVVIAQRRSGISLKGGVEALTDPNSANVLSENKLLGSPPSLLWWYHAWGPAYEDGSPRKGPQQDTPFHPFPPDFDEAFRLIKASGNIHIILYTLFSWWDASNAESFTPEAKASVAEISPGTHYYSEKQGGNITIMCPATTFYKEAVKKMADRLFSRSGIVPDGTYFDLAGTAASLLCYDPKHGHPIGGGYWRTQSMREVIETMRNTGRKHNPEFIVVMEGNSDCYLTALDSWIVFEENTPVRQALYIDYLRPAGDKRTELFVKPDKQLGRSPLESANPGKNFAWGSPLGRFTNGSELWDFQWAKGEAVNPTQDDEAIAYFRNLVAHKWVAEPWLNFGHMLKPLALEDIEPADPAGTLLEESIPHATWRAPDGSIAFVFANGRLTKSVSFSFTLHPERYGLPSDGSLALYKLTPKLTDHAPQPQYEKVVAIEKDVTSRQTLSPGGVLILVAKPR